MAPLQLAAMQGRAAQGDRRDGVPKGSPSSEHPVIPCIHLGGATGETTGVFLVRVRYKDVRTPDMTVALLRPVLGCSFVQNCAFRS